MPFLHIAKGLPSCLPSSSPDVNFQPIGANFRQKGAKVKFYLVLLGVFSGKSETKKGKNKNLFYFWGFRGAAFILFCGGGGGVHWCRWCRAQGFRCPAVCVPSLFLLCSWCIACKYASISRFKGVFRGFWGFRVGLCCLGGLLGLCGFCARVELGG